MRTTRRARRRRTTQNIGRGEEMTTVDGRSGWRGEGEGDKIRVVRTEAREVLERRVERG